MTMIDGAAELRHRTVDETVGFWHEVDDDFWVGNTDGAFLGTIERVDDARYYARNATHASVGEFPTLALAQSAIEASRLTP
ncbi:hypothetical protein AAIB33_15700 [Microbacterium sp. AZCO]|uniref:hypothetical protein n=1 Tax=Microbacterium sp. AZCO TaxID=3142976 RepID=UPI0031F396B7